MIATKSDPETSADRDQVQRLLTALENQYGVPFAQWLQPESRLTSDESESQTQAGEWMALLQSAEVDRRPMTVPLDDDSFLLAVPLAAFEFPHVVAVARIVEIPAAFAKRYAETWLENFGLQKKLEQLANESEALVLQVTQSFEELSLLRNLAAHVGLDSESANAWDIAQRILPELRVAIDAEGLALVLHNDGKQPGTARPPQAHWSGRAVLNDSRCQHVVQQFCKEAADRPVVRNNLSGRQSLGVPELREFVLVEIKSKERLYGWMLACNCLSIAGNKECTTPKGYDGFTSIEGALLATAASMLGGNFHNLAVLRQKDQLFTTFVRSIRGQGPGVSS